MCIHTITRFGVCKGGCGGNFEKFFGVIFDARPYRHSRRPYRHSRVSGNPAVVGTAKDWSFQYRRDSRLRGNDGRGRRRPQNGGHNRP